MADSNFASMTHEVFVPREIVYDLWTTAEHLAQWYPPPSSSDARAEVDLRRGGRFEITWRNAAGGTEAHNGIYIELAPPQRMVYTLVDIDGDELPGEVRVELEDLGGTTRIGIQHFGLTTADARQHRADEWQHALHRLTDYLSVI